MKKRNLNRGSSSGSTRPQISKSNRDAKISHYFQEQTSTESPYKKSLSDIRPMANTSLSDESDFKTPIKPKKQPKLAQSSKVTANDKKKSTKSNVGKKSTKKSTQSLLRITNDNFVNLDVNADHLQIALALSKSEYEVNNPKEKEVDISNILATKTVLPTLARFGIQSNNTKYQTSKNKKSKYKFVRPILFLRTEEDRQSLLETKKSMILNAIYNRSSNFPILDDTKYELESDVLNSLKSEGQPQIFSKQVGNMTKVDYFYSKTLNLPPCTTKCGSLLKNWDEIPGRDRTPPRQIIKDHDDNQSFCEKSFLDEEINIEPNKNDHKKNSEIKNLDEIEEEKNTVMFSPAEVIEIESNSPIMTVNTEELVETYDTDLDDLKIDTPKNKTIKTITRNDSKVSSHLKISENDSFHEKNLNLIPDNTMHTEDEKGDVDIIEINPNSPIYASAEKFVGTPHTEIDYSKNIRSSCLSPDLFESDDEYTRENKTPNLSQSFLESSSLKPNTTNISPKENSSGELIMETDNGIKCFESYSQDSTQFPEDLFDLKHSAEDENTPSDITFETHKESNMEVLDLTQSSTDENMGENIENNSLKTREKSVIDDLFDLKHSSEDTPSDIPFETYKESNIEVLDLTQSSTDENMGENSENNSLKRRENSVIEGILEKDPETVEHGFSSRDEYNFSKSLNVTDYVNQVLNHNFSSNASNMNDKDFANNSEEQDNLNQESNTNEVVCISDEELNYSSIYSTPYIDKPKNKSKLIRNFDEPSIISSDDHSDVMRTDIDLPSTSKKTPQLKHNRLSALQENTTIISKKSLTKAFLEDSFDKLLENVDITNNFVPQNLEQERKENNEQEKVEKTTTPTTKDDVIIKMKNITPMMDYDSMDTPKIVKELNKYGLKPMKRKWGVKVLKHVYESTHPWVETVETGEQSDAEQPLKHKRKKLSKSFGDEEVEETLDVPLSEYEQTSYSRSIKIVGDIINENEINDLIFERKESKRIHSCRIPLQIAWHNFLCVNPEIHENILLYEPLQLEVLHAMLKEEGFKFHVQDLLTFLDKKCITVRIKQNGSNNNRQKKKKESQKSN